MNNLLNKMKQTSVIQKTDGPQQDDPQQLISVHEALQMWGSQIDQIKNNLIGLVIKLDSELKKKSEEIKKIKEEIGKVHETDKL